MTRTNNHIKAFPRKYHDIFVCLLIVAVAVAVYWQVQNHDFVFFDDDYYVYENQHIQEGLTPDSIAWAFSFANTKETYWHPVTWLSHMLDYRLFGLDPGKHHLTNLIFHIANSLLLFLVFKRMTGALWRSALLAILFAIHPINVDTVAWVAERKNVLSTFFGMLTMLAYVYYSRQPASHRYLLVVLFFILGLMAKPMLVTLPCIFLLLDYWPLGRFSFSPLSNKRNAASDKAEMSDPEGFSPFVLVLEKIPLFTLSVLSIIISSISFQGQGKTIPASLVPLKLRIANALVSYVKYIAKMIYPNDLAVLYPYPETVPMWQTLGALVLLGAISVLIIRSARRAPYFIIGWLWFLGSLVPAIGLIQVGLWPAMADRFAYVPFVGLFVIVAWGLAELTVQWQYKKIWRITLTAVLLSCLTTVTWKQVGYWKNSITLFEHALKVTSNNWLLHNNLGVALANKGRTDEAVKHHLKALRLQPGNAGVYYNLAVALEKGGHTDEAVRYYLEALRIQPDYPRAHNNLGVVLANLGRTDDAVDHYSKALRLDPDYVEAHNNLGVVLANKGRTDEAVKHHLKALRLQPGNAGVYYNLAVALEKGGHIDKAIGYYLEALRIQPSCAGAHNNLGVVLARQGKLCDAVSHYLKAIRIQPEYHDAHYNLGNALAKQGHTDEAIVHYQKVLRLKPDYESVHNNLAIALIRKGDTQGAVFHFQEALRIKPDDLDAKKNLDRLEAISK